MNTRKNTLYNVAYRVFSMLLPLVTAPYLSRVVGTEGVGLYGYSWAISYVFVLIGLLGLENYGPREIARVRDDRDALNRTFSAIWKMQRLVAGVTLLVWLVYVFFIAGEEKIIYASSPGWRWALTRRRTRARWTQRGEPSPFWAARLTSLIRRKTGR